MMLKDQRDGIDENEDGELNDMIHQYNEDNELRRKINEMKKQKASQQGNTVNSQEDETPFDLYEDESFTHIHAQEEAGIPDIRVDDDMEKTRVGFQDDSDKTLVIMDRKNKVEPQYHDYTEKELHETRDIEPQEDLRETIRRKKDKIEEDDEEDNEKNKKLNKTITYVIIGVLCVALIAGIGFGVKAIFFSGDDKTEEKDTTKDKTDKKDKEKTDKKETNKTKDDISDNSAQIKQLKAQLDSYNDQLKDVNDDIATAEQAQKDAQAKLDNITALYSAMSDLQTKMNSLNMGSSIEEAKNKMDTDCKADANSEECRASTENYNQYYSLSAQFDVKKQQYDAENAKTNTYMNDQKAASDKIASLKSKKTDLESKVADLTTKINKYENE